MGPRAYEGTGSPYALVEPVPGERAQSKVQPNRMALGGSMASPLTPDHVLSGWLLSLLTSLSVASLSIGFSLWLLSLLVFYRMGMGRRGGSALAV